MDRDDSRTRRRVLQLGAVTASTALVAGCGGPGEEGEEPDAEEDTGNGQEREDETEDADDGDDDDPDDDLATEGDEEDDADLEDESDADEEEGPDEVADADSWEEVDEILLGTSEDQVWIGEAPSLIEGEENPTLELTAGEEYEIGYVNNDGDGHNLSVLADDEDRAATDVNNEEDEEHWLTIEAEEDLTAYRCEVHPDSMEGEIEVTEE